MRPNGVDVSGIPIRRPPPTSFMASSGVSGADGDRRTTAPSCASTCTATMR
jgi:hypothetical protein